MYRPSLIACLSSILARVAGCRVTAFRGSDLGKLSLNERVISAALLTGLVGIGNSAIAAPSAVVLAPHRAVYDMVLSPRQGAGEAQIRTGRMVYEVRGGSCKGYNVSMRWVTQTRGTNGATGVDDLRYVSWEASDGENFTYSSTRYTNNSLVEETEASATKQQDRDGEIILSKPKKMKVVLPKGTLFPTEHVKMLIIDALDGKFLRTDQVYDVSDDGTSIYNTFALTAPLSNKKRDLGVSFDPRLKELDAWSTNISYFLKEEGEEGEGTPVYEQTFALFANGISTHMRLSTPGIVINAALNELKILPEDNCD